MVFDKSHKQLEGDLTQLEKRLKFHETESRDFGKYILRYNPIIMQKCIIENLNACLDTPSLVKF